MTQEQVLAIFKHIKAPILLINARQGYPFDGPLFEGKKCIDTMKEVKIDGGHHVHMDNPQSVFELMVEFYKTNRLF